MATARTSILLGCLLVAAEAAAQPLYRYPAPALHERARPDGRVEQRHRQAEKAMEAGNFAQAYCLWKPLAEGGDVRAQYNLGWMYHNGYGLAIDDEQAMAWWLRAAAQGDPDAQFALGTLYASPDGPDPSPEEAVGWFVTAARKGHEEAPYGLRALVMRGVPPAERAFRDLLREDRAALGDLSRVSVGRANLRAGPGTGHRVLATLEQGRALVELAHEGAWVQVGIVGEGTLGWIHHDLIAPDATR